jgi:hypothetical protein
MIMKNITTAALATSAIAAVVVMVVATVGVIGAHQPAFSQETTTGGICPAENIQHREKTDFIVLSPDVAKKLGVNPSTELNIKILEDPNSVIDMKQKVIDFFKGNATESDKSSIQILGAPYAVICAQ